MKSIVVGWATTRAQMETRNAYKMSVPQGKRLLGDLGADERYEVVLVLYVKW
jgi:hypothetical protein